MRLQELSLKIEVIEVLVFFVKRVLDKMSLVEVIVSRLPFFDGLVFWESKTREYFLHKVGFSSNFHGFEITQF